MMSSHNCPARLPIRLQQSIRNLLAMGTLLVVVSAAGPRAHASGRLVAWGDDSQGLVSSTPSGSFVAVAAGSDFNYPLFSQSAVAIRSNGTLASWGDDSYGQVSATPTGTFTAVATSGPHSVAIRSDGTLAAWGADDHGEVSGPNADGGVFIAVAAAPYHTVGIRSNGTLAAWGSDSNGQVSGPNTDPGTFVAVACGSSGNQGITAAIRTDGTIVNWGWFAYTSIVIPPAGAFSAVSLNAFFGAAIRTDTGSIVIWDGGWEVLGPFTAIATVGSDGGGNMIAIRADGTLAAFGDDSFGQVSGVPGGTYTAVAAAGGFCVAIATPTGNEPPVITCNGPAILWSPDHELIDVHTAFCVSDPDDDPLTLSFRVFSDETEIPDTGDGTGRHAPDFKDEYGWGRGLLVRSERRATENGRFYIMVITADDGNGGVTTAVCIAAVCPRDQMQQSLDTVLAEAAIAAAQVQAEIDNNTLPPSPDAPLGLREHGLSEQLGPIQ